VQGNAQIDGYTLMDEDLVLASRRVVLTTEEIVPTEQLRFDPARTSIPGFAVDAVVHQPMGAYPHECYGHYEADLEEFGRYVGVVRAGGLEGARAYVDGLVAFADHDAYVGSVDADHVAALRRTAEEMMPR
jgi:glutaconate CoA-transferase, subunit A